ncbi:hypothetical protein M9H77_16287 [Catharanthus roseus]|uniref:Uncharacterized protein n=1 Tax=Catharanthus roseus TaxID=4058 RepID=A0ACC0B1D9_CATRO|nr:hypothetical protein M9H77_16287 [Catharanthus roseus]
MAVGCYGVLIARSNCVFDLQDIKHRSSVRWPLLQLLNRDLVLWFDRSNSQWVAFDDKCPHRLAPLSGPEARAVKSPRACATIFSTTVSQGLRFVWPDENGWERARATKPPMLPDDFDKPEFATVTIQWGLFYGNDTLLENVSDPSHIDFTHHKVVANDDNPKISAKFVAPCYSMNNCYGKDVKVPSIFT